MGDKNPNKLMKKKKAVVKAAVQTISEVEPISAKKPKKQYTQTDADFCFELKY